jgi:hypothetical protein
MSFRAPHEKSFFDLETSMQTEPLPSLSTI